MTNLRPIAAISTAGLKLATVGDDRPELLWIAPTRLVVDDTYQRDLSERSQRVIRKAIEGFSWNRFKSPIVVRTDTGALHILDGQHTAIVCASLKIAEIPVMVVKADTLDERARAFVGHNKDRTPVSSIDIYRALVASGDPDALDVANVCKRAGVRIRALSPASVIAEGDTSAVGVIRRMVKQHGVQRARRVLQSLVQAHRAPIAAAEILAAQQIVCVERRDTSVEAMTAAIRADGDNALDKAIATSRKNVLPIYRVLANRWLRRLDEQVTA